MDDLEDSSLAKRVERLEATVEELQRLVRRLNQTLTENGTQVSTTRHLPEVPAGELSSPGIDPPQPPTASLSPSQSLSSLNWPQTGEFWLNRIGIGLLLLGVAFLLKYSVDQGWLTPVVRVGFSLVLGVVLLIMGLRLQRLRRSFSQVLLGGSIATFYITGFACFQRYALVSYSVAFAFMILVTLLAFSLSVRQQQAVLSVIGAVGGLGTPFVLNTNTGSLAGLVGYTCLILGGTSAIYLIQGWRSLVWTSFLGAWVVFWIATDQLAGNDRLVLQLGILFSWLIFWGVPVSRYLLWTKNPQRWSDPTDNPSDLSVSRSTTDLRSLHVHLLTVLTPLITLGLSQGIWPVSDQTWGWIVVGGALLYGLVAGYLRRWSASRQLAYTHTLVVFGLLAIALALLLDGDVLFLALAVEATLLHYLASRLAARRLKGAAHLLFGVVGCWLFQRLVTGPLGSPVMVNPKGLTDLAVIALGLATAFRLRSPKEVQIYQGLLHLAFLGWLWRELSALPDGNGLVTIAWGAYGVILLVVGLRRALTRLQGVGLATLLLVVGKLFLVDLTEVKAIWRILLFLGFGGLFLSLSYYVQTLGPPATKPPRRSD